MESGIETKSYDFVPIEERHGEPRQLFFLWFGENAQIYALVTGAIAITTGLNFWWAIVAILVGNLFGAFLMALHSAQGPRLGLPQMIQSRAQFGYYGSILPLFLVWVMYIAFAAIDIVLAGQGVNTVFKLNLNWSMVLVTIPMILIAIYGYDWIHLFLRYSTWAFVAFFAFLTVLVCVHGVPLKLLNTGGFTMGNFLLSVSVIATWQISYAPYVSDYSRYFHPSKANQTFWETYWGTNISTILLMILGAAICCLAPQSQTMDEIHVLGGPILGAIMCIILCFGLFAPNSTNVYGGAITALSIANNFIKFRSTAALRFVICVIIGALGVLLATVGSGNFMNNLENYMVVCLYFLIPWTSINLTDFYLVHHGSYTTDDFFTSNGPFGRYRWSSIAVFFIGFIIEIPFMNTTVYQGPISKAMGGADIAWIVGLLTIPIYYLIEKRNIAKSKAA